MADREYFGFVWDEEKNKANKSKHGISFETASRVFGDPCLYSEFDSRNSALGDERFVSVGLCNGVVLLSVASTDRDGKTRIISARKAVKKERRLYEANAKTLRGY